MAKGSISCIEMDFFIVLLHVYNTMGWLAKHKNTTSSTNCTFANLYIITKLIAKQFSISLDNITYMYFVRFGK